MPQRTQRYRSRRILSKIRLQAICLGPIAFGLTHLAAFGVEIALTVPGTPNVYVDNEMTA